MQHKTKVKEVKVWWGSKGEIINFLNSDKAQATRWMVQSLGE